jgi:hypothetical protein
VAFTAAQRVKIRLYLGYPVINRYRDPRLEGALDTVAAEPEAQAEVESIMTSIVAVNTSLASSLSTAGFKRVDKIEWFPSTASSGSVSPAVATKRSEGRLFCARLSTLMGVPLWSDYFGERGYGGDAYMGPAHQMGAPLKMG